MINIDIDIIEVARISPKISSFKTNSIQDARDRYENMGCQIDPSVLSRYDIRKKISTSVSDMDKICSNLTKLQSILDLACENYYEAENALMKDADKLKEDVVVNLNTKGSQAHSGGGRPIVTKESEEHIKKTLKDADFNGVSEYVEYSNSKGVIPFSVIPMENSSSYDRFANSPSNLNHYFDEKMMADNQNIIDNMSQYGNQISDQVEQASFANRNNSEFVSPYESSFGDPAWDSYGKNVFQSVAVSTDNKGFVSFENVPVLNKAGELTNGFVNGQTNVAAFYDESKQLWGAIDSNNGHVIQWSEGVKLVENGLYNESRIVPNGFKSVFCR